MNFLWMYTNLPDMLHCMSIIRPWKIHKEETIEKRGPFTLISSIRENPRNGTLTDFLRIHCVDWVAAVPLTAEEEVVLVSQYRQAAEIVSLEVPSGCAHAHEDDYSVAARRELLEETGYDSQNVEALGFIYPNPGMMPVKCHMYLVRDVHKIREQKLDEGEDIEVMRIPLRDIPGMIHEGKIKHAIAICAFAVLREKHPELF